MGLVLLGSYTTLHDNPGVLELWESVVSKLRDPIDPVLVHELQESTLSQPVPQEFIDIIVQESLKVPARVWRDVSIPSVMMITFVSGRVSSTNRILYPTSPGISVLYCRAMNLETERAAILLG